jgi:hypothetical protein
MGLKAFQIVDLNNPVSVQYSDYSIKSFVPVSEFLTIERVQCTVPDTIPSHLNLSKNKKRTPTQIAAMVSHYNLMKKLADGEKFVIMEHDAYLWPNRVDMFKIMLSKIPTTAVWMAGIAVECYTVSQSVAKRYCELVENDTDHLLSGPMTLLHQAGNYVCAREKTRVVWPLYGETGKLVFADNVSKASAGKGKMNDAPVTQYVNLNLGVTIQRNNKPINKQNNPNVHFGDDQS